MFVLYRKGEERGESVGCSLCTKKEGRVKRV